jgi:thiol-disulfide isomerase/thioredoxin
MRLLLLLLLATVGTHEISASISFRNIEVDKAIELAAKQNKFVFIDTYATWCKPCKQMDQVFTDLELSDFFNANFINVKVDMDTRYGKSLGQTYDVVWLPTLIILDSDGSVKNKVDKIVDASELLRLAKEAVRPGQVYVEQSFSSNPFGGASKSAAPKEKKLITEDNAPILYVHDDRASSGRPHIMYHEAYLHVMLQDGKQYEIAKKYLSTQDDWSTDKNIKFIFDFLHTTNSAEFDYFLRNKQRFIEVVGQEQVDRSVSILSYERLYNGYPRPSLDEAITLFGYVEPAQADERAYKYYLNRLNEDHKYGEYRTKAEHYLTNINPYDDEVMYQHSYNHLYHKRENANLSECLKWAQEAVIYNDHNAQYHLHLANVHFALGNKSDSVHHCDRAQGLAVAQGVDTAQITKLRNKLKEL